MHGHRQGEQVEGKSWKKRLRRTVREKRDFLVEITRLTPQRATAALKLFVTRPSESPAVRRQGTSAAPAFPVEQVGNRQILIKRFVHIWILLFDLSTAIDLGSIKFIMESATEESSQKSKI